MVEPFMALPLSEWSSCGRPASPSQASTAHLQREMAPRYSSSRIVCAPSSVLKPAPSRSLPAASEAKITKFRRAFAPASRRLNETSTLSVARVVTANTGTGPARPISVKVAHARHLPVATRTHHAPAQKATPCATRPTSSAPWRPMPEPLWIGDHCLSHRSIDDLVAVEIYQDGLVSDCCSVLSRADRPAHAPGRSASGSLTKLKKRARKWQRRARCALAACAFAATGNVRIACSASRWPVADCSMSVVTRGIPSSVTNLSSRSARACTASRSVPEWRCLTLLISPMRCIAASIELTLTMLNSDSASIIDRTIPKPMLKRRAKGT